MLRCWIFATSQVHADTQTHCDLSATACRELVLLLSSSVQPPEGFPLVETTLPDMLLLLLPLLTPAAVPVAAGPLCHPGYGADT